jgi:hypothetical protein
MESVSRRSFITKGSVGAAGVAAMAAAGPFAARAEAEPALSREELDAINGMTVVHIKDAATGEIELLVGERSVKFTNKALVAKVLRAAR